MAIDMTVEQRSPPHDPRAPRGRDCFAWCRLITLVTLLKGVGLLGYPRRRDEAICGFGDCWGGGRT
jgi:hypothetical protein